MSRLLVPEVHVPAWLFSSRRYEAHHEGRRFLCSDRIAVSVEGAPPVEPSPLRWAFSEARTYHPAPVGRPFLRPDARTLPGDPVQVPRTGLDCDDYAIPVGALLFDLRLVAIVHFLFPGCAWSAPSLPGFAAASIGERIVALVASFAASPDPREDAQIREMVVLHGA